MNGYNLNRLQEKARTGEKLDYIFFWGHIKQGHEAIGKFIFSQWHPSPFTVEDVPYRTAEHWMMAEKARLFGDTDTLAQIIQAPEPKEAKALGRKVSGFVADVWEKACYEIVVKGNMHKFSSDASFKDFLLSTDDKIIVEASPVDTVWGIGLTQDSVHAKDPLHWRGRNLLGFALMDVRDRLR